MTLSFGAISCSRDMPSSTSTTYIECLKQAQALSRQTDQHFLAFMRHLVTFYRAKALWCPEFKHWRLFLDRYKFCTYQRFMRFLRAEKELTTLVDALGVEAACRIMGYKDDGLRKRVVQKTRAWVRRHEVCPTYQCVMQFVKGQEGAPRKQVPKKAQLRAYIQALESRLLLADVPPSTITRLRRKYAYVP